MPSTRNPDLPRNEKGWINLLKGALSGILNVVRKSVSQLFDAIWPPVLRAWNKAKHFVLANPEILLAIIIPIPGALLVLPVAKAVVTVLGFGRAGVTLGSVAAQIQSTLYGAFVPRGSIFAALKSFGAS